MMVKVRLEDLFTQIGISKEGCNERARLRLIE